MDKVVNFINLTKNLNNQALSEICEKVNGATKCIDHKISCVDCPIYSRKNLNEFMMELKGLILAK